MLEWYQNAVVCFTYLSDIVSSMSTAELSQREETGEHTGKRHSEWFDRGWTLQELLAPSQLVFFDKKWQQICSQIELAADISPITGIVARHLTGNKDV